MYYKAITQAISNRLKPTLGSVISETQCAFVPGRIISNNTIVGFECIHIIKRRNRNRGFMAIKLDMVKSYDRVEWKGDRFHHQCFMGCKMLRALRYTFMGLQNAKSLVLHLVSKGIGKDLVADVKSWCEQYLHDFQGVSQDCKHRYSKCEIQGKGGWIPLVGGVYKANCTAMREISGGRVGIGIVIRDFKGEVYASCSQFSKVFLNNKAANLMAILKSIQFVIDCGLEQCVFEVDDEEVVKWIKDGNHKLS
ncbi:hypothetical protein Ddye_018614 [Dipteronia dyeriana]|uniref:RNase H type-1 domain-containing protein n=1 Tax=Dipteronia dyeriana TaxID=168575 RepID=A0AAD9UBH1_9ROSI|nr:hypothetical protein Ddye_018614 [Dipteronia dyeriana]